MNLYLDDDSTARALIGHLVKAGHNVVIPHNLGMSGKKDPYHLVRAIKDDRILITHNHDDFQALHFLVIEVGGHHSGILTVRRDNDPKHNLLARGIVRAIRNLENSGLPFPDNLHILNHWR